MTQEITAAIIPVPWDGSFIPLPPHLCQPSQPPKAEIVTSFLCERCRAFAKWHEASRNSSKGIFHKLNLSPFKNKNNSFDLYRNWNDYYESYQRGCHLCSIIFRCLSENSHHVSMEIWSSNANAIRLRFQYAQLQQSIVPEVCTSGLIEVGTSFTCYEYSFGSEQVKCALANH